MLLSDRDIRERVGSGSLRVNPKPLIKTDGIDLRIGGRVGIDASVASSAIDPTKKTSIENSYKIKTIPDSGFALEPRAFYLLHSLEKIDFPEDLAGIVKLKSSWARLGLLIPPTMINAGSSGQVVAEVFNFRRAPVMIKKGMPFLRILFEELKQKPDEAYRGKYYGQKGIKLPGPVFPE